MSEKMKIVVEIDNYWIFSPLLFTDGPTPAFSYTLIHDGEYSHSIPNVNDYQKPTISHKTLEVDKEFILNYLRVRQEFFSLNEIFENLFRQQEGLINRKSNT